MNLGHWSVIDIETTGINPGVDEIIDLGFLQFEGTKLVRKFSSLVRPQHEISPFITKLTGITNKMLSLAPPWEKVEIDLVTLESHSLIAHNARFEESYLKRYFDDLPEHQPRENFQDSMFYLALLKPEAEALNLEYFITLLGIAEKEEHRGLSDSIDLLKVLLTLTYLTYYETEKRLKLKEIMMSFSEEDFWFKKFFFLSQEELQDIAFQIDFDLETIVNDFLHSQKNDLPVTYTRSEFSLEFNG
ncbi:MAG TPA: 3'-5' exonuclease, partial [Bacteriovoracaceae bacterium]|nr:3'-5' exonuclease [Bacteriovoracaceae bacterium]